MIKVKNKRVSGFIFHYAHFICDCLFPEIVSDIFNYDLNQKLFTKKNVAIGMSIISRNKNSLFSKYKYTNLFN